MIKNDGGENSEIKSSSNMFEFGPEWREMILCKIIR